MSRKALSKESALATRQEVTFPFEVLIKRAALFAGGRARHQKKLYKRLEFSESSPFRTDSPQPVSSARTDTSTLLSAFAVALVSAPAIAAFGRYPRATVST
jgi:hypothetical protein